MRAVFAVMCKGTLREFGCVGLLRVLAFSLSHCKVWYCGLGVARSLANNVEA